MIEDNTNNFYKKLEKEMADLVNVQLLFGFSMEG